MARRKLVAVHLLYLGPRTWFDLGRAALELGRARWRLGRHSGRALMRMARQGNPTNPKAGLTDSTMVDRVAFAVPRVAGHVPWRADCFVQALAAQSWLARTGVPSDILIGVRQDRAPGFEAHAWLRHGDRIVTGGDVSGFVPLVTPDRDL
ncbi:lasso peptide biosynthesis B2 protein [Rubellimicrobium rubrum]|uniref:Lasso peptide biosynthesis B2 protein n=1 Tax=Rubellimicrobium rubrum TaxID=2585369 RepID=A0A5C4MS07_9RHOB|nr:lasso peptide biosynthesis B2 protein [Rubellimicrobium rubrum]TNC46858.1 lasso peptide biosynthesis B2 protein [Rubellimicrobium rubrum]